MIRTLSLSMLIVALSAPALLCAQQAPLAGSSSPDAWTKLLADRSKRGTLHDTTQMVRGDTGKWSDEPQLSHASPLIPPGTKISLDARLDQLLERKSSDATAADDQWLLFRTRQMDDNDRLWIERIERRGNRFTIVLDEAIWQGKYFKTFTYYQVFGVNLGKLPPGNYEATWIVKPLKFKAFEGNGRPATYVDGRQIDNWSKDDAPTADTPIELTVKFTVAAANVPKAKPPKPAPSRDEQSRSESPAVDGFPAVDRTWSVAGASRSPSFTKHVVPLFSKVGCCSRAYHGSIQRKGGSLLSLFGFDLTRAIDQLRRNDGRGSRIDVARVDDSAALRMPLGKVPHDGDQLLQEGSRQCLVLRRCGRCDDEPISKLIA